MAVIRKLSNSDLELHKDNIVRFIYESNIMAYYMESFTPGSAAKKFEELQGYILDSKALVIGCLEDDELVGFLWAYSYPFRDEKNRLYVSILHVDERYRNRHIGNKLLSAAEEEAQKQGYGSVYLHAEGKNTAALSFYAHLGYEEERVQLSKKLNIEREGGRERERAAIISPEIALGCVLLSPELIFKYKSVLSELLYLNTKSHFSCASYTLEDAEHQIESLRQYVADSKAVVVAYIEKAQILGFVWVFPLGFKGEIRHMLNAISVFPNHKGKGVGKSIFQQAEMEMVGRGSQKLFTWVDCVNLPAYKFYLNNGMEPEVYQLCKKI